MHQEGIDGWTAAGAPDAVVTGLDPNLTYLRLAAANDCIRAGARFIATNRDPIYPTERGLRPGAGERRRRRRGRLGGRARCRSASRRRTCSSWPPRRSAGTSRDAIMIGDGIATDLAAAHAVGARCILMLTGVTTRAEVEALPADERPFAIAADAAELAAALEAVPAA